MFFFFFFFTCVVIVVFVTNKKKKKKKRRNILKHSLVRDDFLLLMLNYTIEVFCRSIENSMQQRFIALPRLAMFTFTPAKIQACVTHAS